MRVRFAAEMRQIPVRGIPATGGNVCMAFAGVHSEQLLLVGEQIAGSCIERSNHNFCHTTLVLRYLFVANSAGLAFSLCQVGHTFSAIQLTLCIRTLGGASQKCPYSRNVVIPEVSLL